MATKRCCDKNKSIFNFDQTIPGSDGDGARVRISSIPTAANPLALGAPLDPIAFKVICQSPKILASSVSAPLGFFDTVTVADAGLYEIKFKADVTTANLAGYQVYLVYLAVNGVLIQQTEYVEFLHSTDQVSKLFIRIGLQLAAGSTLQLILAFNNGMTLTFANSKFTVTKFGREAAKRYAEFGFNTIQQILKVPLTFNNFIPNKGIVIDALDPTTIVLKKGGKYLFHLYIGDLSPLENPNNTLYLNSPYEITVLLNDKPIECFSGLLITSLVDDYAYTFPYDNVNLFFEAEAHNHSSLQIFIKSAVALTNGIQTPVSLLEVFRAENECHCD